MGMSEADTRSKLIDPKLHAAGWDEPLIQREFLYKRGRIRLVGEHTTRDNPLFLDYALRDKPRGSLLAVVEAKDQDQGPSAGLGQALGYAIDLGVMFAYSSNGDGIVEHNRLTNAVTAMDAFPSPQELRDRLASADRSRGPRVTNRRGITVNNPLIQPAWTPPSGGGMRWYQERAVQEALLQILAGKHRALLSLATGTGKTFIAFNLCWKLIESGYAKKVLFLADRVNLRDQAFNEFGGFGDARAITGSGHVPLDHDLHFGIYQGLYAPHPDGGRVFQQYPADYFDVIIIDECHRSGYGDWGVILDYFEGAFHLGMTATPKRSDSIDTYQFFASENRDADGAAQPAFEYSLGRGIDDGYLATYRVRQVLTNLDVQGLHIEDEVDRGADLIVPEDAELREIYASSQFEKEVVIPDRTKVLCKHLAGLLRSWGANQKTMVYCVTMEHAAQVRDELQTLLGPETGKDRYAVRIVSEEHDSQALLEQFQLSSSTEPVVATTVDLLTTGVNVPSVRNIVFMKPIGSPSVFRQIIGRGSRLDELTGKEFFRIVDYTGVTRLFDTWDVPPSGAGEIPDTGSGVLSGRVVVHGTTDPIEGASITVRKMMRTLAETTTTKNGTYLIAELPEATLRVDVAARGFTQRSFMAPVTADGPELLIELREPTTGAGKVLISGVTVTLGEEKELTLGSGDRLDVTQYIDHTGHQIRSEAGDLGTLKELWRDPEKRRSLRERLRSQDVDPAILSALLVRPDADEFDLLAHAGYDQPIRTREERARAAAHGHTDLLDLYPEPEQQVVVEALLDKYRLAGVEEIATANVFTVPPFADDLGGIHRLVTLFGGPDGLAEMLRTVQIYLYSEQQAA